MNLNERPSEFIAFLTGISPQSLAAGTLNGSWVDMANIGQILAILRTGTLGASATVDFSLQQAQDSSGTGAKNIAGKAVTQIVKATGDDKTAMINLRSTELDTEGGFRFMRLKIIVGTAASLVSASLLGTSTRYKPADAFNDSSVVQVV